MNQTSKNNSDQNYNLIDLTSSQYSSVNDKIYDKNNRLDIPFISANTAFLWSRRHIVSEYLLPIFSCDLCNLFCNDLTELELHLKQHLEKRCICEVCGRSFTRGTDLKRHRRLHTGEKPYLCQFCGESVIDSSALSKHVQVYHAKIKRHTCTICGKGFVNKKCFENHKLKHGADKDHLPKVKIARPKIYQCEVCSSMFATRWLLKNHQQIHFGELYTCNVCGKKFNRRSNLKCHDNIHQGVRPYKCDLCDYSCAHGSNLIKHKRRHAEIKNTQFSHMQFKNTESAQVSRVNDFQNHEFQRAFSEDTVFQNKEIRDNEFIDSQLKDMELKIDKLRTDFEFQNMSLRHDEVQEAGWSEIELSEDISKENELKKDKIKEAVLDKEDLRKADWREVGLRDGLFMKAELQNAVPSRLKFQDPQFDVGELTDLYLQELKKKTNCIVSVQAFDEEFKNYSNVS